MCVVLSAEPSALTLMSKSPRQSNAYLVGPETNIGHKGLTQQLLAGLQRQEQGDMQQAGSSCSKATPEQRSGASSDPQGPASGYPQPWLVRLLLFKHGRARPRATLALLNNGDHSGVYLV